MINSGTYFITPDGWDVLDSEDVIKAPDAQNTAQRSKSAAKELKDTIDALMGPDAHKYFSEIINPKKK
jgi:hypothetical protein